MIFVAGFEHGSIKELLRYKNTSITISALSSSMPIIAVVLFALFKGFSLLTALFLAVALGATSMGVSLRSLIQVKEIDSRVGKTVIGSLVLNDMTGLMLLTLVASYASVVTGGGANLMWEIAKVFLSILFFFLIFYWGFVHLPRMTTYSVNFRVEEAQFSLALILVLVSAWAASFFGLSAIIGAFFSGVILSRSPIFHNFSFTQKISSLSYGFFIPIFFAFTGAQLSFDNFWDNIVLALIFLALITTVQIGFAFLSAKWHKYSNRESLLVGVGMLPYGEVTLVVMSALITLSSAKPEFFVGQDISGLFSAILLLIIMTIVLTPIFMMLIEKFVKEKTAVKGVVGVGSGSGIAVRRVKRVVKTKKVNKGKKAKSAKRRRK